MKVYINVHIRIQYEDKYLRDRGIDVSVKVNVQTGDIFAYARVREYAAGRSRTYMYIPSGSGSLDKPHNKAKIFLSSRM